MLEFPLSQPEELSHTGAALEQHDFRNVMNRLLALLAVFVLLRPCPAQVCSSVVLPLNVFTQDGLLVRGVSPDHLLVKVHGEAATIVSLSLDVSPRRVVLLLDTSGSMAGHYPHAWQLVPELGAYALDTIPSDASVAVGTIGGAQNISEFGDRTQAGTRVLALTRKSMKGLTPLLDSIHQALLKLDPPHFGDVIYLVTDGGDNMSKFRERQIGKELALRGTRIFALLVADDSPPRTQEQQAGPPLIEGLVKETGGHLMLVPWTSIGPQHRADLFNIAPLIQADIGSGYRLQLSLAKAIKKMAPVQIRYTGPDQRLAKNASWIYPRRIGPCPSSAHP